MWLFLRVQQNLNHMGYNSLPLKYAFFGKKFRVQDLLVEHVIIDL
jgi:hypothetical protein